MVELATVKAAEAKLVRENDLIKNKLTSKCNHAIEK